MILEFEDAGGGRGLTIARFRDRYGVECSIQTSSLATEDAIWLGQHNTTCSQCGGTEPSRMHLTRELVEMLIPVLQHFVDTGVLGYVPALRLVDSEKDSEKT